MTRQGAAALALVGTAIAITTAVSINGASTDFGAPIKTIPTLPAESTIADDPAPATGIAIRARASLTEFLPVVHAMIGSTADVAGELVALAHVPDGILSPAGSSVREVAVSYYGIDEYFVATATFSSDATAEDAVVFYQATLAAAGFIPVSDSVETGEPAVRHLRFDNPTSALADAGIDVRITDGAETEIELTITDNIGADVLQAFTGWAAGLPTIDESQPMEATIRVASASDGDELTVTLSTRYGYDEYTTADLAVAVRSDLPSGGFALDTEADTGSPEEIALRHVAMRDVHAEISGSLDYPATLWLSGTVTL